MQSSTSNFGPEPFVNNVHSITIVVGGDETGVESKGAELLSSRILRRSRIRSEILSENHPQISSRIKRADVVVLVGNPDHHELLRFHMEREHLTTPKLPDTDVLHPEGFAVKTSLAEVPLVLVAGADQRGVIYGAGALLRRMTFHADGVDVPQIEAREKPAFPYRGTVSTSVRPNQLVRDPGKMRPQKEEEVRTGVEDLMLLGANTFRQLEDLAISHGMLTSFMCSANLLAILIEFSSMSTPTTLFAPALLAFKHRWPLPHPRTRIFLPLSSLRSETPKILPG